MPNLHPNLPGRWFVYLKLKGVSGFFSCTHNDSLLLKHLNKYFKKADVPWVDLILEKYYSNGRLLNHTKNVLFGEETI
jgi:hypothetical protein